MRKWTTNFATGPSEIVARAAGLHPIWPDSPDSGVAWALLPGE
jgi:hypothetical protein